jgi:hypothetical protein
MQATIQSNPSWAVSATIQRVLAPQHHLEAPESSQLHPHFEGPSSNDQVLGVVQ